MPLLKKKKKPEEKPGFPKSLVLYFHDLIYMLLTILVVFLLVLRVIIVSGESMYSTLWDGDLVLLEGNLLYQEPKQGDIVVISKESFEDGKAIVKRVIATEGQTVDIDFTQGIVYVDGQALDEPYVQGMTVNEEGVTFPLTVEEGCIFVMGDNRQVSRDSRYPGIGQIDKREVLGKAIFLLYPGTRGGTQERDFDRIGAVS